MDASIGQACELQVSLIDDFICRSIDCVIFRLKHLNQKSMLVQLL
jgi:hypothetical protein